MNSMNSGIIKTANTKTQEEEDKQKRFEVMKLYTTRNSASRLLLNNLKYIHSKSPNTSLKFINTGTSFTTPSLQDKLSTSHQHNNNNHYLDTTCNLDSAHSKHRDHLYHSVSKEQHFKHQGYFFNPSSMSLLIDKRNDCQESCQSTEIKQPKQTVFNKKIAEIATASIVPVQSFNRGYFQSSPPPPSYLDQHFKQPQQGQVQLTCDNSLVDKTGVNSTILKKNVKMNKINLSSIKQYDPFLPNKNKHSLEIDTLQSNENSYQTRSQQKITLVKKELNNTTTSSSFLTKRSIQIPGSCSTRYGQDNQKDIFTTDESNNNNNNNGYAKQAFQKEKLQFIAKSPKKNESDKRKKEEESAFSPNQEILNESGLISKSQWKAELNICEHSDESKQRNDNETTDIIKKQQPMKFHNIPRLTEAKSNNSSDILLDKQKEINNNLLEQYFKEKTLEKSAKMRKIKGYQKHDNNNTNKKVNNNNNNDNNFNIFGSLKDYSHTVQHKLKENIRRLRPSCDVIKYVETESKKIHHKMSTMNVQKNIEMHKMSYRNLAETTINAIHNMVPLFEQGVKSITDRNELDEVLNKIIVESMKTKNLVVQVLCMKAHGKILKLNKNYAKAIELYKQCKNSAEIPMLFKYRLNCYKNLGFCFSQFKIYNFSMFYYGKMLRIAWYLNDQDLELKAYDLIGLQYFYQGNLHTAAYYHNKMISGCYEKNNSDMKRLGISKIDNELRRLDDGLTFSDITSTTVLSTTNIHTTKPSSKQKKFLLKIQNSNNHDQTCDFYISSESEDNFELPIPAYSHKKQNISSQPKYTPFNNSFLSPPSRSSSSQSSSPSSSSFNNRSDNGRQSSLLKKRGKKNQLLFYHKDSYQQKLISEQANRNIRLGAIERNKRLITNVPKKEINASSFKQIKDSIKTPYRLNHLSVNRELENYQCGYSKMTKLKNFNFNELMYDQYEKPIKNSIKIIFENLRDNLLFSMSKLEMLVAKQKSPSKYRKTAFCLPMQYGPQINTPAFH